MKTAVCLLVFFVSTAGAVELKYLASTQIENKKIFEKTTVGGISDLVRSPDGTYWAVTDDRGAHGPARIYQLAINATKSSLSVSLKSVLMIKDLKKNLVVDFEGISFLPWGNFLLASEGDLNHKPRVAPGLFDVKLNGNFARTYDIPQAFLPEKSGKQRTGVSNNRAFEGLSQSPDGTKWLVGTEGSLVQDKGSGYVRLLIYEMPEAWVIKPARQWGYPLTESGGKSQLFKRGLSALLWHKPERVLVLERQLAPNLAEMSAFDVDLYEADVEKAEDISKIKSLKDKKFEPVKKTLVAHLKDILPKDIPAQNFEGIAWGPEIEGVGKTLLLVSDDNFKPELTTLFVLLSYKE